MNIATNSLIISSLTFLEYLVAFASILTDSGML